MSWNDAIPEWPDIADLTFQQMFRGAYDERIAAGLNMAYDYSTSGGGIYPFAIAAGDDVQYLGSFLAGSIVLRSNVQREMSILFTGTFFPPAYDGAPPADYNSVSHQWIESGTTLYTGLGPSNNFTRKYPREFANDSAATYVDYSAFADGHKAWNIARGKVYERVAGEWVLNETATPDVMEASGWCASGDYVTAEMFTEMRNCFNDLIATRAPVVFSSGTRYYGGSYTSRTDAETAYLANVTSGGISYAALDRAAYQPAGYGYRQRSSTAVMTASPRTVAASAVDFYVMAGKPQDGTTAPPYAFDAMGVPDIAEDAFKIVDTAAVSSTATRASKLLGLSTLPGWGSLGLADVGTVGFRINQIFAVAWWDVDGGFAYTSST